MTTIETTLVSPVRIIREGDCMMEAHAGQVLRYQPVSTTVEIDGVTFGIDVSAHKLWLDNDFLGTFGTMRFDKRHRELHLIV